MATKLYSAVGIPYFHTIIFTHYRCKRHG